MLYQASLLGLSKFKLENVDLALKILHVHCTRQGFWAAWPDVVLATQFASLHC